jgi:hypothetical protein
MFDTYVTRGRDTQYVTKEVNITEKRAPTDESVKLLREMEDKARAQLILQVHLPDGPVPLSAVVQHDVMRGGTWFGVKVMVGGREKVLKWHTDLDYSADRQKALDEVFKGCCEAVASVLMEGVTQELFKRARF